MSDINCDFKNVSGIIKTILLLTMTLSIEYEHTLHCSCNLVLQIIQLYDIDQLYLVIKQINTIK